MLESLIELESDLQHLPLNLSSDAWTTEESTYYLLTVVIHFCVTTSLKSLVKLCELFPEEVDLSNTVNLHGYNCLEEVLMGPKVKRFPDYDDQILVKQGYDFEVVPERQV